MIYFISFLATAAATSANISMGSYGIAVFTAFMALFNLVMIGVNVLKESKTTKT